MRQLATMYRRQRGLTMISWMVILLVGAIFAMMAIRLIPVYIEHFSVSSSLTSLMGDMDARGKSPTELQDRLFRRLDVNEVTSVNRDDVTITRDGPVTRVNVAYDVKVPFFYNIDFLVTFDDTVEVPGR